MLDLRDELVSEMQPMPFGRMANDRSPYMSSLPKPYEYLWGSWNISVLTKRLQWRGYSSSVTNVGIGDKFSPDDFDLCYLGGGQDKDQNLIAFDLAEKAPAIRSAADDGVSFLWVCGGIQLAGKRYVDASGSELLGVGLLDLETIAGTERLIGDIAIRSSVDGREFTVVGYENHIGQTYLGQIPVRWGKYYMGMVIILLTKLKEQFNSV